MASSTKLCKNCLEVEIPKGMGQTYCSYRCDDEAKKTRKAKKRALRPKSPVTRTAYPPRTKMIKALVDDAKLQVKIRDNYTCQWCGKPKEGKGCQGSHVIPMSDCGQNALAWDLNNIKVLCAYCHSKWHSGPIQASQWFREKFPERAEYLDNYEQVKISEYEIMVLYDQLKLRHTDSIT